MSESSVSIPPARRPGRLILLLAASFLAALLPVRAWAQNPGSLPDIQARAAQGELEAQNILGNAYTNAQLGLRQDYAEALRWYRQAAERNFAPAHFNLGLAAELGRGLPKDESLALSHYRQAAELGFVAAMFNVGNMFSEGRGVKQDQFEANIWYRQAAEAGLAVAQYNLALSYETGRGVKLDPAQAARWYGRAADQGFGLAQYNLGLMLEDGRAQAKIGTATKWYQAAARQGVAAAQNNLGLIYHEGRDGLARDSVEAAAWLELAVQNGIAPQARDMVAATLSADQKTAAMKRRDEIMASFTADPGGSNPIAPIPSSGMISSSPTAPVSTSRTESEAAWNTRLQAATTTIARLEQTNKQLTEANRLLRMKNTAASLNPDNTTIKSPYGAEKDPVAEAMAGLKRENGALKDEVQRVTRELLWLKQQEKQISETDSTAAARLQVAEAEIRRLTAELASPSPSQPQSAPLPPDITRLQSQITQLQNERNDQEKWIQALEKAVPTRIESAPADTQSGSAVTKQALESQLLKVQQLTKENGDLRKQLDQLDKRLASQTNSRQDKMQAEQIQRHIFELEQKAFILAQEKETIANILANEQINFRDSKERIASLESDLTKAQRRLAVQAEDLEIIRREHAQVLAAAKETPLPPSAAKETSEARALKARVQELETQLNREQEQAAEMATRLKRVQDEHRTLTAAHLSLTLERDNLQARLKESRPPAVAPAATAELRQQLATQETRLATATRDLADARARNEKLEQSLATRPSNPGSVANPDPAYAELARTNTRLQHEQEDLHRLLDSYRTDLTRLRLEARTAAQPTATASTPLQPDTSALTAEVTQLRRELESSRSALARQSDSVAAVERDRSTTIAQLRSENAALSARLRQTQGSLDQIVTSVRRSLPETTSYSSPAPSPLPVVTTTSSPRYHTVAQGDSLSRLSERYYGSANRWQEIYRANGDVLQGATTLRIGQQLVIP